MRISSLLLFLTLLPSAFSQNLLNECKPEIKAEPSVSQENFIAPSLAATMAVIQDAPEYPFSRPVILNPGFHTPEQVCAHARSQGKPYAFLLLKTHHCDMGTKVCANALTAVAHKSNEFLQNNFSIYQTRFYDSTLYGRRVEIPGFRDVAKAWNKLDRNPEMLVMDSATCQVVLRDKFFGSKRGGIGIYSQYDMAARVTAILNVMENTPAMKESFAAKKIPFDINKERQTIVNNLRGHPVWKKIPYAGSATRQIIRDASEQHKARLNSLLMGIPNKRATEDLDAGLDSRNNL